MLQNKAVCPGIHIKQIMADCGHFWLYLHLNQLAVNPLVSTEFDDKYPGIGEAIYLFIYI